jgi:D-glycero-D-manno-heptose 1,7-bisphosphate phosphatase
MRAIFLDRDGVICENRSDHVKSWSEFRFLPDAKASLAALSRLGLPIVVVTNQAAIGRGMVSAEAVEEIHRQMMAEVAAYGGHIERVLYCPHRPDEACDCRKPQPGLLLKAAAEMGLDLTRSYMVGDAATDLLAAQQVGCRSFLVLTGRGMQQLVPAFCLVKHQFMICRNLMGATDQILRAELHITDEAEERRSYTSRYIWRGPLQMDRRPDRLI